MASGKNLFFVLNNSSYLSNYKRKLKADVSCFVSENRRHDYVTYYLISDEIVSNQTHFFCDKNIYFLIYLQKKKITNLVKIHDEVVLKNESCILH